METGKRAGAEVFSLVERLARGRPPEPGAARGWGPPHLEFAREQGLAPWLYQALLHHSPADVPGEILLGLKEDYGQSARSSLLLEVSLRQILAGFQDAELPVLLLKGAYLGPFLYRDPAQRPMSDLDLLVRENDLPQAQAILEKLGFTAWDLEPLPGSAKTFGPSLVFYRNSPPADVDLHYEARFLGYCYRIPGQELWAEARPGELYDRPIFYLGPELNFLYLALHSLVHPESLLRRLDLILFLERFPLNWPHFLSLARAFKVERPLLCFFEDLARTGQLAFPPEIIPFLKSYVPKWWEDLALTGRFRLMWQRLVGARTIPGWGARRRYLWAILCWPPAYREIMYGTRKFLPVMKARLRKLVKR